MEKKQITRTIKKLESIKEIVENGSLTEKELEQLIGLSQSVTASFENELKEINR